MRKGSAAAVVCIALKLIKPIVISSLIFLKEKSDDSAYTKLVQDYEAGREPKP
jgi:hypothetical protein